MTAVSREQQQRFECWPVIDKREESRLVDSLRSERAIRPRLNHHHRGLTLSRSERGFRSRSQFMRDFVPFVDGGGNLLTSNHRCYLAERHGLKES
jgi:hypothetical protein